MAQEKIESEDDQRVALNIPQKRKAAEDPEDNLDRTTLSSATHPPSTNPSNLPPPPNDLSKAQEAVTAPATLEQPSQPIHLTLTHHTGDIFAAPAQTLFIHACNTQGSWGAGIAAAFKDRYPRAYQAYHSHCLSKHVRTGTALLIPPCETDPSRPKHWVGCLFTSARYGRRKDGPEEILANTGPAVRDLLRQVGEGRGVVGARVCKINSGKFGVPWSRTLRVLEEVVVEEEWLGSMEVWSVD